jgi:hypothetical protein
VGTFQGIPDSYDGRVVTKTWNYTGSLPALTDGLPTYVVSLPVPGVAYFYGQVVGGALALTPVYYSDYQSLFPTGYESTNATNFRYAGQALEFIPTVNQMTWTGSVQVFRGPVELSTYAFSASAVALTLNGLSALVNSSKPDAVHPFNMGCFCVSRQTQHDFPFHQIHPSTLTSEVAVSVLSSGTSVTLAGTTPISGCGSMEAIVYKIPSYSAAGNALTLRSWSLMELQVSSTSSLYEYSHISPAHDPVALSLVKKVYNEVQLCVPFYENEGLWSNIWSFIKQATAMLSFVPGPVGEVATGASLIAEAIDKLVV